MYSFSLSLTSALDEVGGQRHASAALPPGKDPASIVQKARWTPGPIWTGAENLAPTGIQSPDRPARSESLYRLRYPGPLKYGIHSQNLHVSIWSVVRNRKVIRKLPVHTLITYLTSQKLENCFKRQTEIKIYITVLLSVCFLGVITHFGYIFHSPVAGFSLLVFEVS